MAGLFRDYVLHFPDGTERPKSWTRLLQPGDEVAFRERERYRVAGVERRNGVWHVLLEQVIALRP